MNEDLSLEVPLQDPGRHNPRTILVVQEGQESQGHQDQAQEDPEAGQEREELLPLDRDQGPQEEDLVVMIEG